MDDPITRNIAIKGKNYLNKVFESAILILDSLFSCVYAKHAVNWMTQLSFAQEVIERVVI
ncbi:hypothetical protein PVOR_23514 [Paenibacillus vortex V453]|uniref:Uncharacterized protein n=2 Tax=Paenibacillus TaxID=44249 RepID=A0A163ELI8_9BACL|nr:hypothetical protein C7121_16555 [Paenibacillus glucanolyticus]EFU40270.1 hypothetical protein PVOR_23514 [Paenibacillus vortex V453]KZS43868.1 hypothetical protein AWU65_27695 [Paenibacillus glucanolyticus]